MAHGRDANQMNYALPSLHHTNPVDNRCIAHVAIQHRLGILSQRGHRFHFVSRVTCCFVALEAAEASRRRHAYRLKSARVERVVPWHAVVA